MCTSLGILAVRLVRQSADNGRTVLSPTARSDTCSHILLSITLRNLGIRPLIVTRVRTTGEPPDAPLTDWKARDSVEGLYDQAPQPFSGLTRGFSGCGRSPRRSSPSSVLCEIRPVSGPGTS